MPIRVPNGREGIYVARVAPAEAAIAAPAIHSFLADSIEGVDPNTAEHYANADPYSPQFDPNLLDEMAAEIDASGRLDRIDQTAYVIARDLTLSEHPGVVGLGVFSRADETDVVIEGLHVAPLYRGRHIGPAILDAAFKELHITAIDSLSADVSVSDVRTAGFWQRIGFIPEPWIHTYPEDRSALQVPYREHIGCQPLVKASVRALLEL